MSTSLLLGKIYRAYREWISNIKGRTEILKEKIQNYILQINTPSHRIEIPSLDFKENMNERLEMYKCLKSIQDTWKEESLIATRIIKKEKDRNINSHIENRFHQLQDNPKKMINSILSKQPRKIDTVRLIERLDNNEINIITDPKDIKKKIDIQTIEY